MKKLFLISAVLFLVTAQSLAQKKAALKTSLLWKIESKKANKPSYLFGSMHMIQKKYYHFSDTLKKYILSVDEVVMELGNMPNQMEMLAKLRLPEGETLDKYFRPTQLDSLLDYMENELSIPRTTYSTMLNKMKPFVLMQTLMAKQFQGEMKSYDLHIMKLAKENELPLFGLETIDEQLSFFDKIPYKKLINNICKQAQNSDSTMKATLQLQKIYASRNLDRIAAMIQNNSSMITTDFQNVFLDKRNLNWVKQLKKRLKKKQLFIAVGAAHLIGQNGLIQLLRQEGYTITPIRY